MVIICNCLKDKIAKLEEDKTVQMVCLGKKRKKEKVKTQERHEYDDSRDALSMRSV